MVSAVAAFSRIVRDIPAATTRVANQTPIVREAEAFKTAIANVDTLDDFMSNRAASRFAIKAFGLEGAVGGKSLVQHVLKEGVDEEADLAYRLNDDRYRQMATVFTFDDEGNATFNAVAVTEVVTAAYNRQALEEQVGSVSDGARLALYFERMADTIEGPWSILADRNLATVVRTALGAPASMGAMSVTRQVAWIERNLDISKLKDSTFREQFLKRFVARYDLEANAGSDPRASLVALLDKVASPRAN